MQHLKKLLADSLVNKLAYISALLDPPTPMVANAREILDEAVTIAAALVTLIREDEENEQLYLDDVPLLSDDAPSL